MHHSDRADSGGQAFGDQQHRHRAILDFYDIRGQGVVEARSRHVVESAALVERHLLGLAELGDVAAGQRLVEIGAVAREQDHPMLVGDQRIREIEPGREGGSVELGHHRADEHPVLDHRHRQEQARQVGGAAIGEFGAVEAFLGFLEITPIGVIVADQRVGGDAVAGRDAIALGIEQGDDVQHLDVVDRREEAAADPGELRVVHDTMLDRLLGGVGIGAVEGGANRVLVRQRGQEALGDLPAARDAGIDRVDIALGVDALAPQIALGEPGLVAPDQEPGGAPPAGERASENPPGPPRASQPGTRGLRPQDRRNDRPAPHHSSPARRLASFSREGNTLSGVKSSDRDAADDIGSDCTFDDPLHTVMDCLLVGVRTGVGMAGQEIVELHSYPMIDQGQHVVELVIAVG